MPDNKTIGYRPTDLDDVPAVDRLLVQLGVGTLLRESVTSVQGRNSNWCGTTERNEQVFVKQIGPLDRELALRRTEQLARAGAGKVSMPVLLGVDAEEGLVVSRLIERAVNGLQLANDGEFDVDRSHAAGESIAKLHNLDPDGFDTTAHPLPPMRAFDGLRLAHYIEASSAELQMWGMLHNDRELIDAIRRLRACDDRDDIPRVPIHGDLRLDQFLVADDTLYLSDFEECRLGDAARDVGAFAGEWLYLALSLLPQSLAGSLAVGQVATHQQIVATGLAEIERRAPFVRAFHTAYAAHRPTTAADEDFVARCASYAGWHMLDRMLASAGHTSRLSPINKAAAGVGRMLLLAPADFASTIGLVQS